MNNTLPNIIKLFAYYKSLGEQTMQQLSEDQLFWKYKDQSNSIAIIVHHLSGNMLSRWTDFLITDGEKDWRNRDYEFEEVIKTRQQLELAWNNGWKCLFTALDSLSDKDLNKTVYIRNSRHAVIDAINRQLAHYAYHIGQIVFIGKMLKNEDWKSLSIKKGKSKSYNQKKFKNPKQNKHFTDDI